MAWNSPPPPRDPQQQPQGPFGHGPQSQPQPGWQDPYARAAMDPLRQVGPHVGAAGSPNAFITNVFGWMTMGLALTGATAWMVAGSETILTFLFGTGLHLGLLLLCLGLVFGLSWGISKMSAAVATGMFLVYSVINGAALAPIFLIYTGASIASVFFITAGTFGAMFLYGWKTQRDLTSVGSLAFMALIGLILAMLVNMFLQSSMMSFIISLVGVLIFVGLTAYDAQKLKDINAHGFDGSEVARKNSILGALTLYLDFINLFLMLLRLLGDRR